MKGQMQNSAASLQGENQRTHMNNSQDMNAAAGHSGSEKPRGRSCASCLFGLLMSSCFLLAGALFMVPFFFIQIPAGYVLAAGSIFVFSFIWQLRATRRGCFIPLLLLVAFLVSESLVIGLLLYDTGAYKTFDFTKAKLALEKHAPGLYDSGRKALQTAADQGQRLFTSGMEWAQTRFEASDSKMVTLEEAFQQHPGSPDVVLALADAYMARNDLASVRLATALYEALVETDPCDTFLARLADAYARMFRFDLAFATAARRTWLPNGGCGKAARQLAYLATCSGNLPRGIFELERILRLDPAEPEEVMLLLAGLYNDVGNKKQAQILLDRIIEQTPAGLSVTKTAVSMKQSIGN